MTGKGKWNMRKIKPDASNSVLISTGHLARDSYLLVRKDNAGYTGSALVQVSNEEDRAMLSMAADAAQDARMGYTALFVRRSQFIPDEKDMVFMKELESDDGTVWDLYYIHDTERAARNVTPVIIHKAPASDTETNYFYMGPEDSRKTPGSASLQIVSSGGSMTCYVNPDNQPGFSIIAKDENGKMVYFNIYEHDGCIIAVNTDDPAYDGGDFRHVYKLPFSPNMQTGSSSGNGPENVYYTHSGARNSMMEGWSNESAYKDGRRRTSGCDITVESPAVTMTCKVTPTGTKWMYGFIITVTDRYGYSNDFMIYHTRNAVSIYRCPDLYAQNGDFPLYATWDMPFKEVKERRANDVKN